MGSYIMGLGLRVLEFRAEGLGFRDGGFRSEIL